MELPASFWSKVNKTETCWLWTGAIKPDGYGRICLNGKSHYPHRLSLSHSLGRPIGNGLVVRHSCRNRHCLNPAHLQEGTQKDNYADSVIDGTNTKGEKQGHSKMTEQQVREIRASDKSLSKLAKIYSVNKSTISMIIKGKTWKSVI
jgi:hypothetical protein